MKSYPSIPRATGQAFEEFDAFVFDKLDGSNIRFEWEPKTGWGKAGTRHRLLDATDPVFAPAIPLFAATWEEPLDRIARVQHWSRLTAFCEFWGTQSFAGRHQPNDPKYLTLIDVAPFGSAMLPPGEFLRLFDGLPIATFLGQERWTRGFVERVRRGEISGITREGVVGKGTNGKGVIMAKAKTQAWIDAVLVLYGPSEGKRIVES